MIKISKSIIAIVLCTICLFSFSTAVFAAENEGIMPCYENISSATLQIGYSGSVGTVTATATRQTGTTHMAGIVNVYHWENNGWVFVDSFSKESTRNSLVISEDFTAKKGHQYKAVFSITATDATTVETDVLECVKTYN